MGKADREFVFNDQQPLTVVTYARREGKTLWMKLLTQQQNTARWAKEVDEALAAHERWKAAQQNSQNS